MNELTKNVNGFFSRRSQELLSALRIVSAFMFMQHGGQKLFGFPVAQRAELELLSLNPGLIGILEVVGGEFVIHSRNATDLRSMA